MQRAVWLTLALMVPLVAGCLGGDDERVVEPADVGYDAAEVQVEEVRVEEVTISGFQDTALDAVVYEPVPAGALEDGVSEPPFPVVVFLHAWGFPKEMYQNLPVENENPVPLPPSDLLQEFAEAGFIVVAYDARGWYQSDGLSTAAGPQEMKDLDAVLDWVEERYHTNGFVGLIGKSYGAGQALLGWAQNDRVTTAVADAGWTDLYEALTPGNVPKLEWTELLYSTGIAGTQARLSDDLHALWVDAHVRQDPAFARGYLGLRSIHDAAATTDKPVLLCQGLQETLFTQAHDVWQQAAGFARAHYYTGGHNQVDRACFDKALDWFRFFLAGIDTQVDTWPVVSTPDASGGAQRIDYTDVPAVEHHALYLREPALTEYEPSATTFSISQRLLANPLHEPSGVSDTLGRPYEAVPEGLRQDPTGVFFTGGAYGSSQVLLGAPRLQLVATEETASGPWQVAATLYLKHEGDLRVLGRTAYAVLDDTHHDNGTVVLEFPWTKADLPTGSSLVLKLASNDPSVFMPLMANYEVTFTGDSSLDVPLFAPEA